jgi:CDP-4-dehydro-6-deoxyglucose reductase, E3
VPLSGVDLVATIEFSGRRIPMQAGETVLDALLRERVEIAHACRSGVCRSCAVIARSGAVPEAAQVGLRAIEPRQGMFLACLCRPSEDLELAEVGDAATVSARIAELERLSASVVRVRLEPEASVEYSPGQYLSLRRADGLARSYSLASVPSDPWLELHIRRIADGQLSRWAYDEAQVGDPVALRGPYGSCCYLADQPDAPLLMVAVGTGLAPLWGVVREALGAGHRGPITLIQAAATPEGLYLREDLRELAAAHPQLRVRACVLRGGGGDGGGGTGGGDEGIEEAAVDELAVAQLRASAEIAGHLAYVCGDPAVVHRVRRGLFLAGLSPRRIFADPFVTSAT